MLIKIKENEYWWGGIVNEGVNMPYGAEDTAVIDTADITKTADQAAGIFLSSAGRYFWSSSPLKAVFWHGEIRVESDGEIHFGCGGKGLKGAYKKVCAEKMRFTKIPPEIYFGAPQYNTWIELGYNQNQKSVLQYARAIKNNGLPAGIFMIDDTWQKGIGTWDFNKERFPEPKKMVDELHEMGFTVMLWLAPILRGSETENYEQLKNLLLKDGTGNPALRWWWEGFDTVLDLSNPDAVSWFCERLEYLRSEYNIDGFKLDAGDLYFYSDDDDTEVRGYEMTKAFNKIGAGYPFNEFRAGYDCGGEPIVFRLQDKRHAWSGDGINCIIPNSLMQGMIGHIFHCPDMIGGGLLDDSFEKTFDPELFIRWTEASALCPMMQFSLAPWRVLSSEHFEIVKDMVRLHEKYAEYITALAKEALNSGEPVMRHMAYEFPDEDFEKCSNQFMLGEKVLVAPVLEKGVQKRCVRLPKGKWKYCGGTVYEGGKEVCVAAPLDVLPYFEKV